MLEQYFVNLGMVLTSIGFVLMVVGIVYAASTVNTNVAQHSKGVDQKLKYFYLAAGVSLGGILLILLATSLN